jgi:3-methyladenine DNA glycosylase AlkD
MKGLLELREKLKRIANPKKAELLQRYFKTGKGEYGEGDIFLGITVPQSRKIAAKFENLDFSSVERLLHSKIHEERLIALFILINKYNTTNHKKIVFHFYMKNMSYINNWDLVDLSAPNIVGEHLLNFQYFARQPRVSDDARQIINLSLLNTASLSKIRHQSKTQPNFNSSESGLPRSVNPAPTTLRSGHFDFSLCEQRVDPRSNERGIGCGVNILFSLAKSENVWEKRIAVLATFQFIKYNLFDDSLKIAEILLRDKHDLIHKAVGWMLREIGKRDLETETKFLDKHYKKMPRTMLRYAIEKFPEKLRINYLKKDN